MYKILENVVDEVWNRKNSNLQNIWKWLVEIPNLNHILNSFMEINIYTFWKCKEDKQEQVISL